PPPPLLPYTTLFRSGPHPHVRGARCGADDRRLRDRRVDHPLLAELLGEAFRDLERPTVAPHVFAQDEDALVALHLLPQPLAQRLEIGDFGHHTLRNHSRSAAGGSPYTSASADSGPGAGS